MFNRKSMKGLFACGLLITSLMATAGATEISTNGGTGNATIDLTVEPTLFSVTVPTSIALNMDEEGTVTAPAANAVAIENKSYGAVEVKSIKVNGATPSDGTQWNVEAYDDAVSTGFNVDSNKVALAFTPYKAENVESDESLDGIAGQQIKTASSGASDIDMTISQKADWQMDGKYGTNKVIQLKTEAVMSGVTKQLDNGHIADVVFTIGWLE